MYLECNKGNVKIFLITIIVVIFPLSAFSDQSIDSVIEGSGIEELHSQTKLNVVHEMIAPHISLMDCREDIRHFAEKTAPFSKFQGKLREIYAQDLTSLELDTTLKFFSSASGKKAKLYNPDGDNKLLSKKEIEEILSFHASKAGAKYRDNDNEAASYIMTESAAIFVDSKAKLSKVIAGKCLSSHEDNLSDYIDMIKKKPDEQRRWLCYEKVSFQENLHSNYVEDPANLKELLSYKTTNKLKKLFHQEVVEKLKNKDYHNRIEFSTKLYEECYSSVKVSYSRDLYTCAYWQSIHHFIYFYKINDNPIEVTIANIMNSWPDISRSKLISDATIIYGSKVKIEKEIFNLFEECIKFI